VRGGFLSKNQYDGAFTILAPGLRRACRRKIARQQKLGRTPPEWMIQMLYNSVNTNVGAMVALQNLNATQKELSETQSRINTGLRVASAKDDGSTWAIAQNQRATSQSLNAVKDSLQRGQSTVDVALAAGQSVSDLLLQMKAKALAASDATLDTNSRTALNNDFVSLRDQISKAVNNAEFNGANMLKGVAPTDINALANSDGTSTITVRAQPMDLGTGALSALTNTSSIGTQTLAFNMIPTIDQAIIDVSTALSSLGTGSKALAAHLDFIGKLQDTVDAGVGNLVDADLAKESAKLQALQTKQQLGVQALSIANQAPQILTSLFR
jgi:flagellin